MLPLDSDSLAKISNFLSHDSERSQKAEAEFQEIDKMLKKITFEF
jgi:predicted neutral ceramidase superfamily lipid hydrolase